jgi:hypothetical protein
VVKQIEEVRVTAQRLIDTKSSTTKQTVSGETLQDLPVENLREAVGLKAGIVNQGGELHVRGGRGGEVKFQVEGIEVANPLFGNSASIANLSVAGAEVLSGGSTPSTATRSRASSTSPPARAATSSAATSSGTPTATASPARRSTTTTASPSAWAAPRRSRR